MSAGGNDSGARKNGIGARLQAARERADLSVVQAAELLHVDPGVLSALEGERFGALGAPVYVRGHLRHYAELLKESVPEIMGLYAASAQAGAAPDLTQMPHVKQASTWRGALLTSGLAVVIGVGLIGSIRWIYLDLHPATAVAAAPASAPVAVPAAEVSTAAPPASAPTSLPEQASSAPSAALPLIKSPRVPRTGPLEASVTLKFRSACWTEVYDAHGVALYHAIGAAGAEETLRGAAPLKVLVGNFAEVDVQIDGQAQVIPAQSQSGAAAQFLVTHEGTLQPVTTVTTAGNKL
ncbi:MAG TPA: RodZ domain-containing protein [Steroidobacteraceae bacterium]|jgi:cytoskeleton protein RodZ|nr:RodZ domain-containing protein [Steroidobacteraceae bacterium]